jgi:hypothetical protein
MMLSSSQMWALPLQHTLGRIVYCGSLGWCIPYVIPPVSQVTFTVLHLGLSYNHTPHCKSHSFIHTYT